MPSPLTARLQRQAGEPVTDELRDEIGSRLNDAFVRGDLDEDRYRDLLAALYRGSTLGELVPVAEALPAAPTYAEPAIVAQPSGPGVIERARPGLIEPARRGRFAAWLVVSLGALAVVLVAIALLVIL